MKKIVEYTLILKGGEVEDRFIRGISVEGGEGVAKLLLGEEPPKFVKVKGRVMATNYIAQLIPVYE